MSKKLLFVVNSPKFFLSHRLPVALAATDAGYEMHVSGKRRWHYHLWDVLMFQAWLEEWEKR